MRHKPKKLEMAWESENRVLASKLEFHIKKSLNKKQKEDLIAKKVNLKDLLNEKIEFEKYREYKI